MKNFNIIGHGLLGLFMAVGIALGGYFVSNILLNANKDTAEAKGLSERRVEANQAIWTIGYGRWAENDSSFSVSNLYLNVEMDQKSIITALKEVGLTDEEINVGTLEYSSKDFRSEDNVLMESRRYLSGNINVETNNVRLIPKARAILNKLIAKGVSVDNNNPRYFFTELNKIKPEMLKEATVNAKIAAEEFAKVASVKVGGIENARQGNFNITDANEDYSSTSKIEKDVRVVTTIKFYLAK